MRALLREVWDTVREISRSTVRETFRPTAGNNTWRESLRILRGSILTGLGERLVGFVIFASVVVMAVLVLALVRELTRSAGGIP